LPFSAPLSKSFKASAIEDCRIKPVAELYQSTKKTVKLLEAASTVAFFFTTPSRYPPTPNESQRRSDFGTISTDLSPGVSKIK